MPMAASPRRPTTALAELPRSGFRPARPPNSRRAELLLRVSGPHRRPRRRHDDFLDHFSEYQTSYAFYDGLLRERQTQAKSPDLAGRLVTEAFYNTRGEAWRSSGTFFSTVAEPVLVTGQDTQYPSSTETVFDGAGRPAAVITKFGDETKRSTTTYTGDSTTVIQPKGGTATTTVVDALGRTVQLKEYTNAEHTASQSTGYHYDKLGRLDEVTDPSGAKWTYGFDVRGRQTDVVDPDKGETHTKYDEGDRVTDTTDARNITLHTDYDDLGRRTAVKNGTTVLSAWTYDDVAKGQLATTTRYIDGKAYVTEITDYSAFDQPAGTKVTVPAGLGVPAGSYEWWSYYNDNTGQLMETEHPAVGGLPEESVHINYDSAGLLRTLSAQSDPLISNTTYDHYGRNTVLEYGKFAQHLKTTSVYDDHTGALTDAYTDRDTAPQRIEDSHYTYDPAGNITQITTNYGQDAARTTDTQCFSLDALTRITEAWTNTGSTCAAAPSGDVVGGQDPYWTSYSYDAVGNRKTETQHQTAAGATADTVRTYAAPDAGKHNLPSVTQTGTDPRTESYSYTETGGTKTRTFKQGTTTTLNQDLVWDVEDHLKSVTSNGQSTSYTYDTDGQRLTRTDSTGTTLYLPDGNELTIDKSGKATGTRYYSTGSQTVAMRTGGKLTFLLADHHGTTTTQVTADAAQAITRRKTGIFGTARGAQLGPWAGDKGFVGGTMDTDTGLTHLGAREYDPSIGRFISVDPIMDLTDPQQLHGYTYANNNPITSTDPSGLKVDNCAYYLNCTANGGTIDETVKAPKKKSSGGGGGSSGGGGGSGQTMRNDDGQVLSCAYGHCLGKVGTVGAEDKAVDYFKSLMPDGPLVDLLQGQVKDARDELLHGCEADEPEVCAAPHAGTFETGFGSLLAKKAAVSATANVLSAELEKLAAKGLLGKNRAGLAGMLELEGESPRLLLAVSGQHEQAGLVPVVGHVFNPIRYIASSTGRNPRVNDTEYKMLTYVANRIGSPSDIKGSLTLVGTQQVCTSCVRVVSQFVRDFPNIRINFKNNNP